MKRIKDLQTLRKAKDKKEDKDNQEIVPVKAYRKTVTLSENIEERKAAGEKLSPTKILSFCTVMCESRNMFVDFPSTVRNMAILKAYFTREDYIASGLADSFSEYIKYLVDYWEFFCGSKYNKWIGLFPDTLPLFRLIWHSDFREALHAFIKENKKKDLKEMTSIQYFRDKIILKFEE